MGQAKKVRGREFLFKLASHLCKTVEELENSMTYTEYLEWQEYHQIEPFFADRMEIQLATQNHISSSVAGGKMKFADFLLSNKQVESKEVDLDALTKQVKGLFG